MNCFIEKAVVALGSQAELAKSIGVSAPFVNDLLHARKAVPARLCVLIEQATHKKVTRSQLRPDIFAEAVEVQP